MNQSVVMRFTHAKSTDTLHPDESEVSAKKRIIWLPQCEKRYFWIVCESNFDKINTKHLALNLNSGKPWLNICVLNEVVRFIGLLH